MGRMYAIPFSAVQVAAVQDLWEILVPSDAVMILHELSIGQEDLVSDENEQMFRATIQRVTGSPDSGSDGSSVTPAPLEQGTAAAGITAECNNTTQLSGGTAVTLRDEWFNARIGYHYQPPPEERPIFSPSTRCVVILPVAPSAETTMSGVAIVEEVGG